MTDPEALRRIVDRAVGGSYEMPDGRSFWIDGPVAREITRRVLSALEERALSPQPVPEFRTITLNSEVVINGIRYDPGTYQIGRVGDTKDEPTF